MIRIDGFFDSLHATESTFGEPVLNGAELKIPTVKLILLGDHPLAVRGWEACAGSLVFTDIAASRRELTPYRGDPRSGEGFLPIVIISDPVPLPAANAELQTFTLEGFYDGTPTAWINEWKIQAGAFFLLVPDDGERPLIDRW
jgi:hypothetical protein